MNKKKEEIIVEIVNNPDPDWYFEEEEKVKISVEGEIITLSSEFVKWLKDWIKD